jgi:TonB-dependent starch-binding outer membrane protein SusC
LTGFETQDRAAIAGHVTTAAGAPIAWATLVIVGDSPRHRDIAAVTSNDGSYRLSGLAPGTYEILVNAEGLEPQVKRIEAHSGATTELNFRLT